MTLRVAIGSDTAHEAVDAVARRLELGGAEVLRIGAAGEAGGTPWPQVGEAVARLVARGEAASGVVCCWTGTGVSIAANKVPGIRAALCGDPETARGARRWNDANVLALALDGADPERAWAIVEAFLETTDVDPAEQANIARLAELDGSAAAGT